MEIKTIDLLSQQRRWLKNDTRDGWKTKLDCTTFSLRVFKAFCKGSGDDHESLVLLNWLKSIKSGIQRHFMKEKTLTS